jgi:hypothetical protein
MKMDRRIRWKIFALAYVTMAVLNMYPFPTRIDPITLLVRAIPIVAGIGLVRFAFDVPNGSKRVWRVIAYLVGFRLFLILPPLWHSSPRPPAGLGPRPMLVAQVIVISGYVAWSFFAWLGLAIYATGERITRKRV